MAPGAISMELGRTHLSWTFIFNPNNKGEIAMKQCLSVALFAVVLSVGAVSCGVGSLSSEPDTSTTTSGERSGDTTPTTVKATAGKIAFVSYRDDSINEVYVMNTDGSNQLRVSSHSGNAWTEMDLDPVWSPDASKIVFTSWRDGLNELFIVNSDGTGEARLTSLATATAWNDEASWSPDGSKIAFTSYRTGGTQIYTMNADGSNQTRITKATQPYLGQGLTFYYANWSPDGSQITAETHWSSSSPVDAGGIYSFTSGSINGGNQLTYSADDHNAMWSPDGTQLAFYRSNSSANTTGADIYVASSGVADTKLAEGINPIWSPDGTKIAFLRNDNGFKLFVMDADGSAEVNLMSGFDNLGTSWKPSWSTDGSQLVFSDGSEIYVINADGTGLAKITTGAKASDPAWSPQ